MPIQRSGYLLPLVILIYCSAMPATAAPRVELELITEPGFSTAGSHKWLKMLGDLNLGNLRIRSAGPREKVEVRQRGSGNSTVYQVTGLLTTRNTLRLPGGEFRYGDKPGIARWITKLKEGGESGLHETAGAFGLTATQLVAVHEALSMPVTFSTKDQNSFDAMKKIADGLKLSFVADHGAMRVMSGDKSVRDELQRLSAGTALAAILRPLGLALVPKKHPGGEIKLLITDVRNAPESWPAGWPSEKPPRETLPDLFNFLPVEIEDQPLADVLEIIGSRIKAPILYDYNSLARHEIEPAKIKVSHPRVRTYYRRIIDRLANQAKMKSDLRVDEAGKPFMWISSIRR